MVLTNRLVNRLEMLIRPFLAILLAASAIGMSTATAQHTKESQIEDTFELSLASGYFATPISIQQKGPASITSIRLSAKLSSGQGDGILELNCTPLKFNDFGDFEVNGPHQSESIPIQLRKVVVREDNLAGKPEATNKPDRSLYSLTFKDGTANFSLVVPKLESETYRLIIREEDAMHILPLSHLCLEKGEVKTVEPKVADSTSVPIDLSTDYLRTEIGFKLFRIQGVVAQGNPQEAKSDASAKFYLNPNHLFFNAWGEVGMTTLLGWEPHIVELRPRSVIDPLGQGRKLFEIARPEPRQTQYLLVYSPNNSRHRLVIKSEDTVIHVAPLHAAQEQGAGAVPNAELPFPTN